MLNIVIPAHNEEKRIGRTLEEYCRYFKEKVKQGELDGFSILVVINNCKDNTKEVVESYKEKYKEILYLNYEQGGKGFAVIEGFKFALNKGYDLIGFVDADMATLPEHYFDLVKNIGRYEAITASRWKKNARNNMDWKRIITSRGFNFGVRALLFLPYSDTQCGAKLFTKKAIEAILPELKITKWAFDIDLLYQLKRKKMRVREIPTVWEEKRGGSINFLVIFQMGLAVVRLRIYYSPFRDILRAYDLLPGILKIHHRF